MALTPYCTQADLTNRLSADGVAYRTDDVPPGVLGDVLAEAATVIDEYCRLGYDPTNLAQSDWVTKRATDIAAFMLCQRRGNPVPPGVAQKYERTLERLELVRLGRLSIPDAPGRRNQVPVLSNLRVRLDPFPRVVVDRYSGPTRERAQDYRQAVDYSEPMFYYYL
jgi:phage gp36-like protein